MRKRVHGAWIEEVTHSWILGKKAIVNSSGEEGIITGITNVTPDEGEPGWVIEITCGHWIGSMAFELVSIKGDQN